MPPRSIITDTLLSETIVYNAFYNLRKDPFRLTPDPVFLYMTAQHREALAGLVHSACNRSGLTVLAGEAGTGVLISVAG